MALTGRAYLDNGRSGHRSDALRDDVEDSLQDAHVAADQQSYGDGGIYVAAANVSEGLQQ